MAYEPTTWRTGDVVTSTKLNKLEQGVAGAVFVLTFNWDEGTESYVPDKTYAEVAAAYAAGTPVFACIDGDALTGVYQREDVFEAHSVYVSDMTESSASIALEVIRLKSDDTVEEQYGEFSLS